MKSRIDKIGSKSKLFNSQSGLSTKKWGPKLWDSLFSMIIGSYPPTLNVNNKDHIKIKKAFINTMYYLRYTLPCSFCRASYKEFYKQLPIENFTGSRIDMMYWLYSMKDLVNIKLIKQEKEYLKNLNKEYKEKQITKEEYHKNLKICFKTVKSPSFLTVLNNYESLRAPCSKKIKKCI